MKLRIFLGRYKRIMKERVKRVQRQFESALRWSRMEVDRDASIGPEVILSGSGKAIVGRRCIFVGEALIETGAPQSKIIFDADTKIDRGSRIAIFGTGEIRIGANCYIGKDATLICEDGAQIEIAEGVRVESKVLIISKSVVRIGAGSSIGMATSIASREKGFSGQFICGQNCYIHQDNFFDTTGSIVLENDARTGPYDVFYTHEHSVQGRELIWNQPVETKDIFIGRGAWIGAHATVLMGVQIGEGAVVGAGAVVTKSIDSYYIVGGVPARKIRSRIGG